MRSLNFIMNAFIKKYIGIRAFYKAVLAVALPIMIQNGITNFVSLLDNIMVGMVGNEQMTGVSIVNQLIFVFNLTMFGAVSGIGIFTAQFHGSKNTDGVRNTFRFKLIVGTVITVIGIGIMIFAGDLLISLYLRGEGTPEEIALSAKYAKEYLMIMIFGLLPFALTSAYSGTLRETGETVLPMKAGILAVLVNLVFNAILIYGLFGLPSLGSAGAAIATVLSRYVEASIIIIWTHTHKSRNKFIVGAYRSFRLPSALVVQMTKKGLPLLLNEMFWSGGMAILTQCYSLHGYDVVSAVNISSTIANVFNVSFIAMGSAIGIIIGQLLGAGKKEEAVDTDRKLIVFSVLLCTAVGLIMAATSPFFPNIYKTSPEIRTLASELILVTAVCTPISALANACYFTLRSGGKTFITILFDSCFVCVVTVPMAFLLKLFTPIPIVPLYFCCHAIDILKCVVGLIMIKKGIWINNIVEQSDKLTDAVECK